MDGLTVAQSEYDAELKARRDAESEVTRLRVLLSGQAARLSVMSGVTAKQELQQRFSQQMTDDLSGLERQMSKLRVERDMTLAEVEELSASKSTGSLSESSSSRSLTHRLDGLKSQYTAELEALVAGKEALLRECAELKASRDVFLEETTALNARNEELAKLSAQYTRRVDAATAESKRSGSFDRARPTAYASTSNTSLAPSADDPGSPYVRVPRPDGIDTTPMSKRGFKWPGSKTQREPTTPAAPVAQPPALAPAPVLQVTPVPPPAPIPVPQGIEPKGKMEHQFQQLNGLRITRCDHCGDKMWGSQYRCGACNISIHSRCLYQVEKSCAGPPAEDGGVSGPMRTSTISHAWWETPDLTNCVM
jgi:hypothetical protein